METFGDIFPAFSGTKYSCIFCDYHSSKKSHFKEHLSTRKHYFSVHGDKKVTNPAPFRSDDKWCCDACGKTYISRNGLWKHKKTCPKKETQGASVNHSFIDRDAVEKELIEKESIDKELLLMIVKQNKELMEIIKNGTHNNNSYNNHNSNNKTFNLQFFLNETCKDALNISEFVESIKPQIADLETTGRIGYVEGISNIITNNLKTLDSNERPFHCSDNKREIIYIKDNNEWTKESDDKPILTRAIKQIANENIKNISKWQQLYPDCKNSDSKKNNQYLRIVSNSMSGSTVEESQKNISKIISNIAKQVVINKKIETI